MKSSLFFKCSILLLFLTSKMTYANHAFYDLKKDTLSSKEGKLNYTISKKQLPQIINVGLPILKATGNQIYCPQTSLNIVTDFTINDSEKTSTEAIYIQISIGYNDTQDLLSLTGSHPSIIANWDINTGRLTLTSSNPGSLVSYTEFINAIKDVVYTNSSLKPTGNRSFSISVDKVSFLPSNNHFYEFVPGSGPAPKFGLDWGVANDLANAKKYYGLQGYLATILSAEENQLAATQQSGTGWIGGSDIVEEGIWRWMSGPEKGIQFFYNLESTMTPGVYRSNPRGIGSTLNYVNWNRSSRNWYAGIPYYEPDNLYNIDNEDEDYAIIVENDGLGTKGSWNDINYYGESYKGSQQANGYIVEYGGMPGDPEIHIATSTSLIIPQITETSTDSRCGTGTLTLGATSNLGTINWYETENGGTAIATGTSFTTPEITKTTTYYVETKYPLCTKSATRTPIIATILNIPVITTPNSKFSLCGEGDITLTASVSEGTIYWYSEPTGSSLIGIGNSLTRFLSTNTTFYIEAVNKNCTTGARLPVEVVVYDLPKFQDQNIVKCKDEKITIAGSLYGVKYLWSTNETTPTIEINTPGTYTVAVTRPAPESCILTETITVIENPAPKIKEVLIEENTISIQLETPADYFEFSIDGINFQRSNVFPKYTSGLQTATVRDTKNCSFDSQTFITIIMPKFFTPNNDTFNDFWEVKGLENYPEATVTLFDRYGKLITILNPSNTTWDGTFNGADLPASDYWYVLKLDSESPEIRGHFSLKR
ncbi:T9SS type B sorting domain-containing protein [Flavobacterium sp. WC2421]|uniref:T9SS type B sorting domain-containing protein n=1 Tax=Flavobacterium sp. WC2421 TaxID=3234138 RepID=UPI0034655F34